MSMPPPPSYRPPGPAGGHQAGRRPSVEHIVLGAVLIAVVLGAAGWLVLKPGGSPAASPAAAVKPAVTNVSTPPTSAVPAVKKQAGAHKSLTRAAYIRASNPICARMNAQSKAMGDPAAGPDAVAGFLRGQVAIIQHALKQLAALPPPRQDVARLRGLYAEVAQVDTYTLKAAAAYEAGDTVTARSWLDKVAAGGPKTNADFDAYGMKVCGSD